MKFLYSEVPEGRGRPTMNMVSMPSLGSSLDVVTSEKSLRTGKVLGVVSLSFLGQLWLIVLMSLLSGFLGWDWTLWHDCLRWSFPLSLFGVHLFGMFSSNLSDGEVTLGQWSIGLFWLGVLIWVPLQIMLSFILG